MPFLPPACVRDLLTGPLLGGGSPTALVLRARLCDLRPRFLAKGCCAAGYRAVSRNGRVLFASDRPLEEWVGRVAHLRLQAWHRAILPGERPEPYGLLLCVRSLPDHEDEPPLGTRLVGAPGEGYALGLALGGGLTLEFRRESPCSATGS